MLVNGRESDGAAVTIALKNGENIIRIETTSIDGSVTDVYVLTVTRGAAASEPTEPDTAEPGEQSPSNPDASGTEGEAPTAFTQKDATQAPTGPDNVDIPGTGSGASVAMLAVLVIGAVDTERGMWVCLMGSGGLKMKWAAAKGFAAAHLFLGLGVVFLLPQLL